MSRNVKAIESWMRHLKGNAATALLAPAFLEAIHRFTPQGFTYGVNKPTVLLILLAMGVATITVVSQLLTKSRPEFAPEIRFVANDATQLLEKQLSPNVVVTTPVTVNPIPLDTFTPSV